MYQNEFRNENKTDLTISNEANTDSLETKICWTIISQVDKGIFGEIGTTNWRNGARSREQW